ncbi:MAG: hypothetical protein ACP5UJ_09025, partial [Athalassotoga sp.]|uniref:hypothetical protein n=1 Tax=Athalassotoga sp. TaxID=2022597 RepID=UPI003D023551
MDYIVYNLLHTKNIDRIILEIQEKYKDLYKARYGDGTDKVKIEYNSQNKENTANALQGYIPLLHGNSFMLIMGDIVFDTNLDVIINYYNLYKGKYNVITVSPYEENEIACEIKEKFITKIFNKRIRKFSAAGIYIFNKNDIDGKMVENFDSVLPDLAKNR